MKSVSACLILLMLFALFSCRESKYDVNIKNLAIEMEFINLDSILFNAKQNEFLTVKKRIEKKDADLFAYTLGYCYHIETTSDTAYFNGISLFYQDPYIQLLEQTIAKKFPKKKREEQEINDAFKRLNFHFPTKVLPKRIAFINSLFSASVNCSDQFIAIGLDRYLGKNEKVIKKLPGNQFYDWIKEGMDKQFLSRDVILSWLMAHYLPETTENFSSEMIRWGKLLFITHACLPQLSEHLIVRYSKKDYDWATNSEASLWRYLVEEELLFVTSEEPRQNLLHEGPFTSGLPPESPDRMGQFLGYQMVKNYMDKEDISLEQLLALPYNSILQSYEPE